MREKRRKRGSRRRNLEIASSAVICSAFLGPGCGDSVSDPPAPPLCDYLSEFPPLSFDVDIRNVPADSEAQIVGTASHVLIDRIDSVAVSTNLGLVSSASITDDSTFTFGWRPVDPSVGIVAGSGSIAALVFVSTVEPPPDSACQFTRSLPVEVDSEGNGTFVGVKVSELLSPAFDASVELESTAGRRCVLRCVIENPLTGNKAGWEIPGLYEFEWIAPAGEIRRNGDPVVTWIAPASPGLYQVQVVVRKGATGLAIGHLNIKVE